MPINGLSNRDLDFPEIGRLRKGGKKRKNAQGKDIYGEDLAYFRPDFAEGEEKAAALFRTAYGEQPNNIRILLPFNEIERVWDPWKEAYTAGRLVARSDGLFVEYMTNAQGDVLVYKGKDKNGNPVPHPADDIAGKDYQGKPVKFKNSGRLKVIVRDLARVAYMVVLTSSSHDIANISGQLKAFKHINNEQLAGIPFILRRRPALISTPDEKTKQRVRRKKYLISVEVDPDWAKAKFGELNRLALPDFSGADALPPELPAGEVIETELDDDDLEGEEVAESLPVREMVEVLSQRAVEYAAKYWNCTTEKAAQDLAGKNLGKLIAWDDLVDVVEGRPVSGA